LGRIPDEIIQKVRDHCDVVELVGRTVTLKRTGRSYKGLCPFHDEKTPSFNVNPDRQSFYCFGCNEGGDIFSFLMKTESLTFAEAVRSLAAEAGIEIPAAQRGDGGQTERLLEANALLHERYRAELSRAGCPGASYLAQRGLDPDSIERFGIGWAPDRWDFAVSILREARIPSEVGERAGLLSRRSSGGHYDLLRGRVVFPIQDARGRVVGFGGRAIAQGQEPKYLNSPESPVFHKRQAFYGLPHALEAIRRRGRAVVVEGYFDRIALHRAGVEEAVATSGTALGADHARNLRRRTREVVLLFDGDEAGQRAMGRALELLLPEGLRVRAAALPPGEDPDSFLVREGAAALQALVDAAPAALDVVIDRALAAGHDSPWAKADAVAAVAPLLARIPSGVERSEYGVRLALAVGTEPQHVEAAVRAAAKGEDARDAVPVEPRRQGPEERNLRQLARSLVEHPVLAARVARDELSELVPPGPLAELVTVLVDAAAAARSVEIEEIATRLSQEATTLLRSLAALDDAPSEDVAARTIDDTLRWLRRRRLKEHKKALTRQLRDPGADAQALLEKKQRLISTDPPVDPPPAGRAM
jgi:DNA primase